MTIVIEALDLNKTIQTSSDHTLTILQNINLRITAESSVAITGTSGSGKTTLLSLLAGLDVASSGQIHLLGNEISVLDEDQRAALRLGQIGFVYQSFHLMSHLTALENVMLPLELDDKQQNRQQQATQALQRVGLGERLLHLPNQLSGGEQQRVALARAFVTQPTLLFADEPTGNLDPKTGNAVIKLLFSLKKHYQTTLILVTHDQQLAQQCEQHYHLQDSLLVLQ